VILAHSRDLVHLPQHALDKVKEIAELLDGLIVTPVQPDVANPKRLVDIIGGI
jgi:hypothetical protein